MTKTYITPKMKEPELVMTPAGKKDAQGNKIARKTIQFYPNATGCGQFTTSDEKVQKFLDEHEYMTDGNMICLTGAAPSTAHVEEKTRQGVQSTSDEVPEAPVVKTKPARAARVK